MAELNVRKRGAKWEYRFEGAKIEGKRKQVTKGGFKTKKEAKDAGVKALAEFNRAGLVFEPTEISVHDYLDYWFDQFCKVNLKYNTQLNYRGVIENHLKPKLGHYKLKALNPSILQDFGNELKKIGMAKNTATGILSVLSVSLDYAVHPLNYIQMNPLKMVRYPKIERKPRERFVLSMEDWNAILKRFPEGNRFYIPLLIGFYTGLRISEAFALTWEDINFENKELTVNKQLIARNFGEDPRRTLKVKLKKEKQSGWYFGSCKTAASYRTIKIGPTLLNALQKEKERQEKNEETYGEYYTIQRIKKEVDEKGNPLSRILPVQKCVESTLPRCNLVCIEENGFATNPNTFKYCSRVIKYELGIAFNYHSLRHTHATLLIQEGANVKNVQMRLGHDKIETTLQTYVHDTEAMADESVDLFEKYTVNQ